MIKMNIKTSREFKTLSKRLRRFKNEVESETRSRIEEIHKTAPARYERVVDNNVYSKYEPASYRRTEHIKGKHGAAQESVSLTGTNKRYQFYIDESSRDPVDGETWADKARKIEGGASLMFGAENPMPNRPFISEAMKEMDLLAQKHHNEYMRKINASLKRI